MNHPQDFSHEAKLAVLVNKYSTPFAILLISLGIIVSQPQGIIKIVSVGLLFLGIIVNMTTLSFLKRNTGVGPWFLEFRLGTNLGINIVIVYLLGAYWPPIWLLLALTPLATAIYSTRARTLRVAVGVSLLLLAIHATRHIQSPMEWGQQIAYAAFILLLSPMINELARLAKLSKNQ